MLEQDGSLGGCEVFEEKQADSVWGEKQNRFPEVQAAWFQTGWSCDKSTKAEFKCGSFAGQMW